MNTTTRTTSGVKSATMMKAVVMGVLLVTAAALGYVWGQHQSPAAPSAAEGVAAADEPSVLYWYDPMVPDQHFDQPGKSPFMDMMLVPRYADEVSAGGVSIDPGLRQSLGIRTALVELDVVGDQVTAPGTLQWDLREEHSLSARVESLVDRVHVAAPYQRVKRGQVLATLLAPGLSAALAEYRVLARAESASSRALLAAAVQRLQLLGLSEADLRAQTGSEVPRILLRAPVSGVLSEIMLRPGQTVLAGQPLFRINATDRVWLEAQVPQAQAGTVTAGSAVEVRVDALPDQDFTGMVEALLPIIDRGTRTQTARIVLDNPQGTLAAGMFAEVRLLGAELRRCPWIPSAALILTGHEARVIVENDQGRFRPVRVRTGRQVGERTEILDGLNGGERVVVSGQFLIDSEASLSGLLSRLESDQADTDSAQKQADDDKPALKHTHGERP